MSEIDSVHIQLLVSGEQFMHNRIEWVMHLRKAGVVFSFPFLNPTLAHCTP